MKDLYFFVALTVRASNRPRPGGFAAGNLKLCRSGDLGCHAPNVTVLSLYMARNANEELSPHQVCLIAAGRRAQWLTCPSRPHTSAQHSCSAKRIDA